MRSGIEIVEILDSYLKEKNLTRKQFCALVDIPQSTIATWKHKNILPTTELIAKVAAFMNVSLDWLVNGDENNRIYNKLIEINEQLPGFSELSENQKSAIANLVKDLSK